MTTGRINQVAIHYTSSNIAYRKPRKIKFEALRYISRIKMIFFVAKFILLLLYNIYRTVSIN